MKQTIYALFIGLLFSVGTSGATMVCTKDSLHVYPDKNFIPELVVFSVGLVDCAVGYLRPERYDDELLWNEARETVGRFSTWLGVKAFITASILTAVKALRNGEPIFVITKDGVQAQTIRTPWTLIKEIRCTKYIHDTDLIARIPFTLEFVATDNRVSILRETASPYTTSTIITLLESLSGKRVIVVTGA